MSATSTNRRESWDSMSSSFAHLEISFSHDSSYGSDEVSVSSKATTLDSSTSTCVVKPFLKSILKTSITNIQTEDDSDSESESAYGSEQIDSDYDALSEDGDSDDDDNMSDFSVWDEDALHDAPQTHEDHTEQFDDSFIGFGSSVCFDPNVEYIKSPDLELPEGESPDDSKDGSPIESPAEEMTCHEMMLLAQQSGSLTISIQQLDDFTIDALDTDRNIFVAFMNGLHGMDDKKYKPYLHTQAENIRQGLQFESMHPEDVPCLFLENLTAHVVGTFRNLLEKTEMDDLVSLHHEDQKESLQKIERFLRDRLMHGLIEVSPDELSFLAGSVEKTL